jgi:hypothetical protein
MHKIESILGMVLGLGIMAYVVGVRIYGIYLGVHESQRSDREVPSGVQTLFQDGRIEPEPEYSEIQTLFSNKDSN